MGAQDQTKLDASIRAQLYVSTNRDILVAEERGTKTGLHRALIAIVLSMVYLVIAIWIKHAPSGAAIISDGPRGDISCVEWREAIEVRIHNDLPGRACRMSHSCRICSAKG